MSDERKVGEPPGDSKWAKQVGKDLPGVAFFEPKADGKYYGEIVHVDKNVLAQQVGEKAVVAHPRDRLGDLPLDPNLTNAQALKALKGQVVDVVYAGEWGEVTPASPEKWLERKGRTLADSGAVDIAQASLGNKVGVYNPPDQTWGLSTKYEGVVVAVSENTMIQRINSRTAIVHAVSNALSQELNIGDTVAVSYDKGSLKAIEAIEKAQTRGREALGKNASRPAVDSGDLDTQRRNSFFLARNVVRSRYGEETKIYDALKVDENGKYVGTIVVKTNHHVLQRIGNNKFIAHDRSLIAGEVKRGDFLEMQYKDGKATAVARERRQDRPQERPASTRSPERGGMER
jgi:hypothetical protein